MYNTVIGTGILSIPYAIAGVGLFSGTVLLLICALASVISLRSLIVSTDKAFGIPGRRPRRLSSWIQEGEPSYGALGHHVFGTTGAVFVDIILAITSFGFAVSCFLEVGDCAPRLMTQLFGELNPETSLYIQFFYDRNFWILSKCFYF